MSNKHDHKNLFSGMGLYIALILCAVAIGIAGFVFTRPEPETVTVQSTLSAEDPLEAAEFVPALASESSEETQPPATTAARRQQEPTQATKPATEPTQPQKALKTMAPLSGDEIFGYSMEALSYNQTTRDWRVHNGIDLAAEEGTPVFAAADGTVTSAYEDDTMGYTVTISHQGGYVTTYSSLQEGLSVKSGDQVHLGQVIGCVGSTALVETTLGPHLHFGVTSQGKTMDPAQFIALGAK